MRGARATPEKINDVSWKQLLKNRSSYELWNSNTDVANSCGLKDGTKRRLKIEFFPEFHQPIIDDFTITSGKEIRFSKELQTKLSSSSLLKRNKADAYFIVTVLDVLLPTADSTELEQNVAELLKTPNLERPQGVTQPEKVTQTVEVVKRDPKVKAWVIQNAKGKCECCKAPAFIKEDGSHYLEVHHLHPLAENGSDTIQNTVAVCANCHRKLHYAQDKEQMKQDLISRLKRLVNE